MDKNIALEARFCSHNPARLHFQLHSMIVAFYYKTIFVNKCKTNFLKNVKSQHTNTAKISREKCKVTSPLIHRGKRAESACARSRGFPRFPPGVRARMRTLQEREEERRDRTVLIMLFSRSLSLFAHVLARALSQVGDDYVIVDVVLLVVGLFRLVGLGLGGLGVLLDGLAPLLLAPVQQLDDYVADAADNQDVKHHVELHAGAEVRAVGVGDDEASRLPEPIVGERGFLVATEQRAVEACGEEWTIIRVGWLIRVGL